MGCKDRENEMIRVMDTGYESLDKFPVDEIIVVPWAIAKKI
jgi:hypothetical protein